MAIGRDTPHLEQRPNHKYDLRWVNWTAIKKLVEQRLTGSARFVVMKADWHERKNMSKVKDLELTIPFEYHELLDQTLIIEVRSALIMILRANGFADSPHVRILAI